MFEWSALKTDALVLKHHAINIHNDDTKYPNPHCNWPVSYENITFIETTLETLIVC